MICKIDLAFKANNNYCNDLQRDASVKHTLGCLWCVTENQKVLNCVVLNHSIPLSEE